MKLQAWMNLHQISLTLHFYFIFMHLLLDKMHHLYISFFYRFVSSPEEVLEVIEEGKSNRHIAVTSMNFSKIN